MATQSIRMKDIAERAGCSATAVSLALRNSKEVSLQKRQMIQALAKQMGYQPNPMVSSLISYRRRPSKNDSDVIAVLTKFGGPARQAAAFDEFYSSLWAGIEARAQELGFRIEEFPIAKTDAAESRALTRILYSRGIRSVILFPGGDLFKGYPKLDWQHFCTVACAFHDSELAVHRIASDHSKAMEIALHNLTLLGCKRPGLALAEKLDPGLRYAISGRFLSWQQGQVPRQRVPLIENAGIPLAKDAFMAWFRRYSPDAVLALDPRAGAWVNAINRTAKRPTAFVHLAKKSADPYAGVNLHTFDVGQASIDTLARELYLNRYGLPRHPETILLTGSWENGTGTYRLHKNAGSSAEAASGTSVKS